MEGPALNFIGVMLGGIFISLGVANSLLSRIASALEKLAREQDSEGREEGT
jgi:hypothetical protein